MSLLGFAPRPLSAEADTANRPGASTWANVAVLTIGFLAIASYCYFVSRHRILWSDEIFAWYLLTDSTWRHMFYAWRQGADGGGAGFYVLCRLWLDTFGHSVLSFRAFSAAGCFLGFAALWRVLTRYYDAALAAVSILAVWFGSTTILWQMVQTRFYGLLLGATALALLAAVRSAEDADTAGTQRRSTLALAVLANTILIESHPFGTLYSLAILTGCFVADRLAGRKRLSFFLAALAPLALLVFSVTAMRNSAKVAKPWFWTVTPNYHDLLEAYTPDWIITRTRKTVGLLAVFAILALTARRVRETFRAKSALLLPGLALALCPILIYLLSLHGTSYFVNRYVLPFTIGIAVLMTEALAQFFLLFRDRRLRSVVRFCTLAFLLLCGAKSARNYARDFKLPPRDYTRALLAQLPPDLPVVFERPDIFDMMVFQHPPQAARFHFVLDWPTTIAPAAPRGLASGYHEMDNMEQVGYYSPQTVVPWQRFVDHTDRFVTVTEPGLLWFQTRIRNNPDWSTRKLGRFDDNGWVQDIWLAQRRDSATTAPASSSAK